MSMTEKERELLRTLTIAVQRMLKHHELTDTEKMVREAGNAVYDERIAVEFQPAIDALGTLEVSLEHTGGGIYVLYYRWDDNNPDGPCVGITKSETFDGGPGWFVVGYESYEDDTNEFQQSNVPTEQLASTVVAIAGRVREKIAQSESLWVIPGEFTVTFDRDPSDQDAKVVRYNFSPHAGSPGGSRPFGFYTGDFPSDEDKFWHSIGNSLTDGQITANWEG